MSTEHFPGCQIFCVVSIRAPVEMFIFKISWHHGSSSWEEEVGSGPGTEVKEGPAGNAPKWEAGEEYPPQGLCQAGLDPHLFIVTTTRDRQG